MISDVGAISYTGNMITDSSFEFPSAAWSMVNSGKVSYPSRLPSRIKAIFLFKAIIDFDGHPTVAVESPKGLCTQLIAGLSPATTYQLSANARLSDEWDANGYAEIGVTMGKKTLASWRVTWQAFQSKTIKVFIPASSVDLATVYFKV